MTRTDYTRPTVGDFKDYEDGVAYLYGGLKELVRLFVTGNCTIEFLRHEYQRSNQMHDELDARFIKPLLSEGQQEPVVQLPRL